MRRSLSTPRFGGLPPLLVLIGLLLAIAGPAAACAEQEEKKPGEAGIKVVTSTALLADLIRPVAGERAQVIALVPGGADPHTYEPLPSQVIDITEAELVLLNGLGFEETLADVIEENVGGDVPVIEMSEGLPVLDSGDHGSGNPHLWLNVRHAMRYVEVARDALTQVDPTGEEEYRSSAQTYLAELEKLDRQVEEGVASIPAERRKLVTFHDAFPYLAERYGLQVIGFVLRSPGREPSASEVAELSQKISAENVPAVFREPQFSARVLELAAEDAGVEVCTLYSDAFDDKVHTYLELMRHNAAELVRCLAGNAGE